MPLDSPLSLFRHRRAVRFLCLGLGLGTLAMIPPAGADTVLVTLEKDNAVAEVDGASGEVRRTVPVGKRPKGIAAGKEGKVVYVASSEENLIATLDGRTLTPTGSVPVDRDPKTFALNPAETRLFASNDDNNQLTVVDVGSRQVLRRIAVGREPEGVSISPDGQWVVSTGEMDGSVWWIDTETLSPATKTPVDPRPRYSRFTDDGKQLWVTSHGGASLTIIDVETKQSVKRLAFNIPGVADRDIGPLGIRIDRERRFAYVALGRANRIAVVDARTLEVLKYIPVGNRVWNLEFSPDQKRLYAANGLSNDLSIIGLPSGEEVIKTVPVGNGPWGIAVLP
jgi:PQQ-dependent catabolism-associated beta-propeller protein